MKNGLLAGTQKAHEATFLSLSQVQSLVEAELLMRA